MTGRAIELADGLVFPGAEHATAISPDTLDVRVLDLKGALYGCGDHLLIQTREDGEPRIFYDAYPPDYVPINRRQVEPSDLATTLACAGPLGGVESRPPDQVYGDMAIWCSRVNAAEFRNLATGELVYPSKRDFPDSPVRVGCTGAAEVGDALYLTIYDGGLDDGVTSGLYRVTSLDDLTADLLTPHPRSLSLSAVGGLLVSFDNNAYRVLVFDPATGEELATVPVSDSTRHAYGIGSYFIVQDDHGLDMYAVDP